MIQLNVFIKIKAVNVAVDEVGTRIKEHFSFKHKNSHSSTLFNSRSSVGKTGPEPEH